MADISKCENEGCPLRFQCYRYMAVANELWQSYHPYDYNEDSNGEISCEDFIEIKK